MRAFLIVLFFGNFCRIASAANLYEVLEHADLTPAQNVALEKLRALPTSDSVTAVRLNIDAVLNREALTINPTHSDLVPDSIEHQDSTTVWKGKVKGLPDGSSIFIIKEGNVTGTIQTEEDLIRVRPIGGGIQAIIKTRSDRFPPEHPPSFIEQERRLVPPVVVPSTRGDAVPGKKSQISVFVGYTVAAAGAVTDIDSLINLAIQETQQAYDNSGVNIQISRVGGIYKADYAEKGDFQKDLNELVSGQDPSLSEMRKQRSTSKANIIVLLINNNQYCGLANTIFAKNASEAAVVVYQDCATGYYSFGHEIGHLMGARHNEDEDPSATPFAYGHGYYNLTVKQRTIMSYECPGVVCRRMPQWSRPSGWGDANLHDNTRVLNETAPLISTLH